MPCNSYRDTITESGGTELGVDAIADGEFLKRVGDEIVGAAGGGGVTDHGALTGLGDDDHPQYALADGSRGTFEVAGAVAAHVAAGDPHAQYQKESEKNMPTGYAGLNGSSLVVQNPASATATPTPAAIPIADGSGTLDAWVTPYTPEVIAAYDNAGGTAIGAPVAINLVQVNTAPGNFTLPGGGHINIATAGSYLVRYAVGYLGMAPNAISNYQAVLQTAPTGSGLWVNVVGSDSYAERVNPAGRIGSLVGESGIVVPPGGLDVQISTVLIIGSPAVAQAQASRLVIQRVA